MFIPRLFDAKFVRVAMIKIMDWLTAPVTMVRQHRAQKDCGLIQATSVSTLDLGDSNSEINNVQTKTLVRAMIQDNRIYKYLSFIFWSSFFIIVYYCLISLIYLYIK